jgi:polyisoprenoid-binding protein YceI|tara:strand:- start:188 stop:772 length:585 start_codon:yes stop_codon:yes gene_type:complete
MKVRLKRLMMIVLLVSVAPLSFGKPVTYEIDPNHTFPAFEADHMGGLSLWRGKINSTSGEIVLDKKNKTGSVNVVMEMLSIDFGHDEMNKRAKSDDMFDIEEFPQASYEGKLINFQDGAPTKVEGELTLHGITKNVDLEIKAFKCRLHPFKLREVCGADLRGNIMRDDFGIKYGKMLGFKMGVALRIGVEAIKK